MEVRIGERRAVGCHEHVRAREIRRLRGHELDLHRPLRQPRLRRSAEGVGRSVGPRRRGRRILRREEPRERSRAAARVPRRCDRLGRLARMLRRRGRDSWCRPLSREHRLLVVGFRLALHERDGPGRACRQAVAQPVAVVVAQEPRLATHQADRALVACFCAQPASVAGNLVYLHDRTDHLRLLRSPSLAASARSASREPPSAPEPVPVGASLPSHPPRFRCIYNIPYHNRFFANEKTVVQPLPRFSGPAAPRPLSSAVPQFRRTLSVSASPLFSFSFPRSLIPPQALPLRFCNNTAPQ